MKKVQIVLRNALEKVLGMSVKAKVISGIVAATMVVGTTAGIVVYNNNVEEKKALEITKEDKDNTIKKDISSEKEEIKDKEDTSDKEEVKEVTTEEVKENTTEEVTSTTDSNTKSNSGNSTTTTTGNKTSTSGSTSSNGTTSNGGASSNGGSSNNSSSNNSPTANNNYESWSWSYPNGVVYNYTCTSTAWSNKYSWVSDKSTVSSFLSELDKIAYSVGYGVSEDYIKSKLVGKNFNGHIISNVIINRYEVPGFINNELVNQEEYLKDRGVGNAVGGNFTSVLIDYDNLEGDQGVAHYMKVTVTF